MSVGRRRRRNHARIRTGRTERYGERGGNLIIAPLKTFGLGYVYDWVHRIICVSHVDVRLCDELRKLRLVATETIFGNRAGQIKEGCAQLRGETNYRTAVYGSGKVRYEARLVW